MANFEKIHDGFFENSHDFIQKIKKSSQKIENFCSNLVNPNGYLTQHPVGFDNKVL